MKRAKCPQQSEGKADANLFRLAENVCLRENAGLVDGHFVEVSGFRFQVSGFSR
jgi:hypothetical protein